MKQSHGHGSSLQKLQDLMQTDYIHLYTKMMMKHSRSGRKRSESHQRESSVLEKKITSGSMVQDLADHVQRSTMIVERNTDVEAQTVQQDVTAIVIWKYGTTYLHSLRMTDTTIIHNQRTRTLIQVWDWNVLLLQYRKQILSLMQTLSKQSVMKSVRLLVLLMVSITRQMYLSV